MGETRAGGGGRFAIEVACWSGHCSYEALSRVMTGFSAFALCRLILYNQWSRGGGSIMFGEMPAVNNSFGSDFSFCSSGVL